MGVKAAELALEGRSGVMVALQRDEMVAVPLADACDQPRAVDPSRHADARWFGV